MIEKVVPGVFLRSELLRRQEKNPLYSTRAFARDIGMSQALLSSIFSGKRRVTLEQAGKISTLMRLKPRQEKLFMDSVRFQLPTDSKRDQRIQEARQRIDAVFHPQMIDGDEFQAMAKWHHLAILTLSHLPSFEAAPRWIAKKLGISEGEAASAVDRLIKLGLFKKTETGLSSVTRHIKVANPVPQEAVREFHHAMLGKAQEALAESGADAFERRLITGLSLTIDQKSVPEAKEYLNSVKEELKRRFASDQADQVYQLNLQFFPLTKE